MWRTACAVLRALCALFVMLLAATALASASIQVNKAFAPNSVALGGNSTVTVTLQNDSTASAATITTFSDDIGTMSGHANLLSSPAPSTTCTGGIPTISGQVLSMNNGVIPKAPNSSTLGSCTITFTVVGAVIGNGFNTISAANVVTSLGSPSADVTQTLSVQSVNVTATPSPTSATTASVQEGDTTTVTYVIKNPASVPLTNAAFPITSNSSLSYTLTGYTTSCGGSATVPGTSGTTGTVSFSGLTIPASPATCTVTISVTTPVVSTVNFTLSASGITDDQGATNSAGYSAQAKFVNGVPNITKSFSPTAIAPPGTTTLTISIKNVLTDKPLTNAAFTDVLPASLTLAATPTVNGNCGSPTLGTAGSATLSFSGGTIATNSTCTVTATVNMPSSQAAGQLTNTIPTTSFTSTEANGSASAATATLQATGAGGGISIAEPSPQPTSAGVNTPVLITLKFTSLAGGVFSGGTFTDTLPQTAQPMIAVTDAAHLPTFASCGSSPSVTFGGTGGNTTVMGSGLALTANGTCTVTFYAEFSTTTSTSRVDANQLTNTNVTFTGTSGAVSPTQSVSANITELPTLSISNYVASATGPLNQNLTVAATINDSSATADTNAVAVINLNATYVKLAPTPNFTFSNCPSGLSASNIVVASSREQFTVTIGAISATCTIGYDVINEAATVVGTSYVPGNPTYSSTLTGGTAIPSTGQNSVTFATTTVNVTKSFTPNQIQSGGNSTTDIGLSAPQAGALARTQVNGIAFSDALPANVAFSPTPNVTFTAGCSQSAQPAPAFSISGTTISFTNISLLTVGTTETTCDVKFDVTSSIVGAPLNQIPAGAITSQSGTTNTQVAKASLTVNAGLGIAKTFLNPSLQIGGTDYIRFLITNSASSSALSGGTLVDAMPSSLVLASTTLGAQQNGDPALCGGSVAGPVGTGTLNLSGLAVAGYASASSPGQCVVYVQVQASATAAAGSVSNTIAAGGLNLGGYSNATAATGTLTLTAPPGPTITKTFAPTAIAPGGNAVLSISIANTATGAAALSGLALTDTLPSGVTIATTPGAATTCGAGTITAAAGSSSVALASGTVAAAATCTITVSVTGSAVGSYTNTIPASSLTTTQGATNTAAATATLMIASVTVSKAFAPATIAAGSPSTLTITIPNTAAGAVALSGMALSDALPSGLTIAATPNASTTCGAGTVTAVAGGATLGLAGGSVAANATCTINADVTASVAAAYTNTIATGALTTTQGVSNPSPATATLTVNLSGITLAKAFAPAVIGAGGTSVLTITIPNTATGSVALSAMALSDALPSGVTIAATPNAATTCGAGTVSAAAGGTSVALAAGTLAASATCTISVSVTATAAATYTNTIPISALTTTQGVTNPASATANLTVNLNTITLAKAFAPATIPAGGISTLTITIPNTAAGSVALSGMALTDTLPSGLTIASTPNAATTCEGGTVAAAAGSASVALSAGTLNANGTCTITVSVTGATAASYTNTIAASALTTTQGVSNSAPATANLAITLNSITLAKAFAPATIPAGGTSVLTITIPNTAAGSVALSGMALTDTLPSGLTIAATPNAATTCEGGTVAAAAGSASVALSAGTLNANGTCTITVSVTGTAVATYTNTIPVSALTTTQTASNSAPASANLSIVAPNVTLAKAFAPAATVPGATSLLTLTIANTAPSAVALGGLSLSDAYPAGLVNAATPAAATTCPSGSATALAGSGSLTLAAGTLAAGASCTVTVHVSAPLGDYTNTIAAGALTTTQGATNVASASAEFSVATAPNLTLGTAFAPASISPNAISTLTITLANTGTGNVALSSLTVSDALPAGVTIAAVPNGATTCGSGTVGATAGGTNVSLAAGTLAAGATCTISVNVTGATPNTYTNTIPANDVTSLQGASNGIPASGTLTIVTPGAVGLSKAFVPASIVPGATSVLTITVANVAEGSVALSNVALSDGLPTGMTIAAVPNASTTCTAGSVTALPAGTSITLGGATLASGASCTVTVTVTGTTPSAYTNTIPAHALTSSETGTNSAPATAILTVFAPNVTLTKAFAPVSVVRGATSLLTLTIANSSTSSVALTGLALSDAYPAGLVNAATPNAATTCPSGTVTAAAGSASLALAGGTLAANASCTVTVSVGAPVGTYPNSIAANALTSTQGATNDAAANAELTVSTAPNLALTAAFSPVSIVPNTNSTLTITLVNTGTGNVALSGLALSDALPSGISIAGVPNASTTCGAGTVTAVAAANSVALSSGTLGAGGTCTISVSVTGATPNTYTDTIAAGNVTSTQGASNAAPASATLTILAPNVTLTKAFTPASIVLGSTSLLTLTISNTASSSVALTGLALNDAYPTGLVNAAIPGVTTSCPTGSATAAAGSATLALTGGTLAAGASCTVTVNVTAPVGAYTNTVAAGALTTTQGATTTAATTANLTVAAAPNLALSMAFAPTSIAVAGTSTLTISLANSGTGNVALSGLALSDALPAGITIATVPNAATTCGAGTVAAAGGGANVTLSGGTLGAGETCTVTLSVTGTIPNTYANTIPAGNVTSTQGASNIAPASATLTILASSPTVANAFLPASIPAGTISKLTVTIANTGSSANALGNVALNDVFPAGVVLAPVPNAATTCASGLAAGTAGGTTLALTGASLAAGATCTLSANVTSSIVATYTNTIAASALSDTQGLTNVAPASATLSVVAISPVTIAKSFLPASVPLGQPSLLTISIANTGLAAVALTNATLSDALPAGMTVAATASAATTCTAGTVSAVSGSSSISLAGATLAAGASCTLSLNVTSTTPGASINTIAPGAFGNAQGATSAAAASATLTVTGTRLVTLAKAFSPASIVSGGTSILTLTIANAFPGAIALTSLALTDALPAGVVVAAVPNAATTCGTGAVTAVAQATTFGLSAGTLAAGATCTISVTVTSLVTGSHVDTSAIGAVTDAQNVSNLTPAGAALAVTPAPAITLAQSFLPTSIPAAATSVLTISLRNTAASAVSLSSVALTDGLPAGVVIAGVPNAVTTCPAGAVTATPAAATFALSGATLAPNATCTVAVTVTAGKAGVYINAIPAGAITSAQAATNAAASQATLTATTVGALVVTKTSDVAGAAVHSGQQIAYTVAIVNKGTIAETGAKITDVLTNATLVPGSVRVNGVPVTDAVVTGAATFGTIAAGATVTIAYAATVNANAASGASVTNSATAGGDQGCAGTGCSAAAPPDVVPPPSLAVTLLIDGQTSVIVTLGQIVTYSATVRNVGGSTAQNVTLSDSVPAGVTAVPGSITTSPSASSERRSTSNAASRSASNAAALAASIGTIDGQTVTASLGDVAPGASATMTFRATITSPIKGFVANLVTVGATGIPSVVTSNTVVARMVAATLNVTKTTGASVVETGDRVDYAVQIAAPAGIAFGATTIVDQLPDYLLFAPGTARINGIANSPTVSGHRLTWTIPALHGPITLTYATAVAPGAPPNTTLDNLVTVTSAARGPGPAGGGSASAAVQVAATTFGNCYPITGRVYDDIKQTGSFESGDVGIAGVRIVLDDGESAVTDAFGRYDFPCVRPGMHALRLDEETLPPANVPYADHAIDSERSTRRLVHSTFDSTIIQDINFAVTQRKD